MKLETQKLLPEDSLTLITKRVSDLWSLEQTDLWYLQDNGTCLNEVDTTSCDTARRSILSESLLLFGLIFDLSLFRNRRSYSWRECSSSIINSSAGSSISDKWTSFGRWSEKTRRSHCISSCRPSSNLICSPCSGFSGCNGCSSHPTERRRPCDHGWTTRPAHCRTAKSGCGCSGCDFQWICSICSRSFDGDNCIGCCVDAPESRRSAAIDGGCSCCSCCISLFTATSHQQKAIVWC